MATRPKRKAEDPIELPLIRRDYRNEDRHYVYPLGDVHIGAASHRAGMWEEWLDFLLKRENCSMLGTGDFLNAALKDSKSDVYEERLTVGEAKRRLIRQLEPIAHKIDGLTPGNHEDRITRATGDCPIRDVCDALNVPYIPAAALIVYRVGKVDYTVYLRHGTGNGQSMAALTKSRSVIQADISITGHTHRQQVLVEDAFVVEGGRVVRRPWYAVSSGSFMGYEAYAAQRGYSPGRLGAPRIYLDGVRYDPHVSI